MNELITILVLIYTGLLGFIVIDLLNLITTNDKLIKYSVGFGVGFGLMVSQMLLYQFLNIKWTSYLLLIPNILIITYYFVRKRPKLRINLKIKASLNTVLILLVCSLIFFTFFESIIRPLTSWDGWSSWQAKAKIYYIDGKVTLSSFSYIESEYPIAVSLYSTYLYEVLGRVDDVSVQLVSAYFYILIGMLSFSYLRKNTSLRFALIFTLLILSTQNLIRHGGRYEAGMADIVIAYFLLAAVIHLNMIVEEKNTKILPLFFIITGIITQVKNEGIVIGFVLAALCVYKHVKDHEVKKLLPVVWFLIPLLGWSTFKVLYHLPRGILFNKFEYSNNLLYNIPISQLKEFFNLKNWNFGWLFFIATIPLILRKKKYLYSFLVILIQFFIYLFLFFFSNINPLIHSQGIYDRLLLQLYPASIVLSALITFKTYGKKSTNRIFGYLM